MPMTINLVTKFSLYLAPFTVPYIQSSSFMLGSYIGIIFQVFFQLIS